jgi:predicted HTH domain antitoxin
VPVKTGDFAAHNRRIKSVDLNLQWELYQLVRLRQPDLLDMALRQVMAANEGLRWSMVVGAYLDGQISLGKAAELLNLHSLQLRERFLKLGIPLRVGPADAAEARAEVASARSDAARAAGNFAPPLDDRHS